MITSIEIRDLRIAASHGVLPQERVVGHLFRIDLTLWLDLTRAMRSDSLADTVSYADVVALVRDEMRRPSSLLEHAAARILDHLTEAFPQVCDAELRLAKLSPPVAGADLGECAVRIRLAEP